MNIVQSEWEYLQMCISKPKLGSDPKFTERTSMPWVSSGVFIKLFLKFSKGFSGNRPL